MSGIEVLAGDFPLGRAEFGFGMIVCPKKPKNGFPKDVVIKLNEELVQVEITSEEQANQLAKAAGTSLAAGLLFGPVGLVIGGLLGAADKQKKKFLFTAKLSGNRQMLAKTDEKTLSNLQAIASKNKIN